MGLVRVHCLYVLVYDTYTTPSHLCSKMCEEAEAAEPACQLHKEFFCLSVCQVDCGYREYSLDVVLEVGRKDHAKILHVDRHVIHKLGRVFTSIQVLLCVY